ncbi:MAG TPA: lipopolysaccharide heptosyltransferase II [Myxococcota bacterium]|nr:lipopolysaccharide heptosyltransferase II [Myxococcota bacterium]
MTATSGSGSTAAISRVVVRAPNWLGDAVMALPAMAAVRAAYPRARLDVAAIASVAPLFHEGSSVAPDGVLVVDKDHEADQLRAPGFELAILLPNSFRTAWVARRAGVAERWGYAASFRGPLLTRAVRRPRGRLHQSEYYRHLTRALDCADVDPIPAVTVLPGTSARAAALLEEAGAGGRPLVGFAPGAAYGHAKRWPPARVAALVERLARDGVDCVLVGAADDRGAGREIESALPRGARAIDLIGRTDLRMLMGVLARCAAFVSNDSGAMHLAAAVGVPVTAVFGPTDERATAPLGPHDVLVHQVFCRPCMLRDCPIDHRCMKGITVDDVYASVTRHLAGAR